MVHSTNIESCESGCWTSNSASLWLWRNYFLWWKVLSFSSLKYVILVFSDLSLRCTYMTNLQMGGHKFYCSFSDYKSFSQLQFDIKLWLLWTALIRMIVIYIFMVLAWTSKHVTGSRIQIRSPKYHFGYSLISRYKV